MIRFTAPSVLLGLCVLPLIVIALRGRGRRRALIALRVIVVGLLVLSAAGMEVHRAVPDLSVVLAADRSDSIGPDGARLLRAFLDDVRSKANVGRRVGLVAFGADAVLEEVPNDHPRLALASRPRTDGTNLAEALARSLSALPDGTGRRIVLLTDGQANAGELTPVLAELRARGVELAVVPIAPDPPPDVMVEEVTMPHAASVGERLPVTVTLRATAVAQADLRVRANGALLLAREVSLRPGRTRIDLEPIATQAGLLRIDAAIDGTPDGEPGNNRAFALGFITGPPFVVYASAQPGPLPQALEAQDLRVRRAAPVQLPASLAGYQGAAAVVLDDVPAYVLNPQQLAALRDYVRVGGGGLVVVGGTQSFGIGGYAGTPLEEALPVSMDVRHRLAIPSLAIVLVLDASGSMGSFGAELAKVELAKETAQSVVDLLGERDLIGVLAFDQVPRWLVRPTPASERARILDAVSRIKAGGGTNLFPALEAARDALRQVEAKVKHVIVLSDGQTDPGAFQNLVTGMSDEKITISTVSIGRDADLEIMRNVAHWGRGRSYVTRDLYSIPQILTAEALLATRAYVIEERFTPRLVGAPAVFADLGAIPPLRGYLATAPKPSAEVALVSHQDDPIVATWTYGLGRAVAITTDARFRWTAEWSDWPRAARFWSQAVRWAASRETGALDVHAETAGDRLRVVLDARAADGTPFVSWEARAVVIGDGGEVASAPLVQTRAGWYETAMRLPPPGAYVVRVTAAEGTRPVGRAALPLAVPYSPELRQVGLKRAVISHLVEAGGARIITTPQEALAPPGNPARRSQPVWPLFGGLALAGFVAEVALRRIPAIEYHLGRLAAAAIAFVRRAPSPVQTAEDAEYGAADRWRIEEPAEAAARAASMEAAARLYIARLRRQQGGAEPEDQPDR
ncbi:MAG: VWA domain-containing protein [Armatimonadota bacterium]